MNLRILNARSLSLAMERPRNVRKTRKNKGKKRNVGKKETRKKKDS